MEKRVVRLHGADNCIRMLCPSVAGVGEIRCMAELDSPPQQKQTRLMAAGSADAAAEMEWNEELFL